MGRRDLTQRCARTEIPLINNGNWRIGKEVIAADLNRQWSAYWYNNLSAEDTSRVLRGNPSEDSTNNCRIVIYVAV
jgi:hypothetical protein